MKKIRILVMLAMGITMFGYHGAAADESQSRAEANNKVLKESLDLLEIKASVIKKLLIEEDYDKLEAMLDDAINKYEDDYVYEAYLLNSFENFDPAMGVTGKQVDAWVDTKRSAIAYAARGIYKSAAGFRVRGGQYISKVPEESIEKMVELHQQAQRDLKVAVMKDSRIMPAYYYLLKISYNSRLELTPKTVLEWAEEHHLKSYYLRFTYMVSLMPKWGGSYGQMQEFAKNAQQYVDLNPRIWSLQGMLYAEQAAGWYRNEDYAKAHQLYSQALQFGDRTAWLTYRGGSLYKLGRLSEALADYQKVLYYFPDHENAQKWVKFLEGKLNQ